MVREFTNEDCMELMARYPDKHFDLAIVDPPYGIGMGKRKEIGKRSGGRSFSRAKTSNWDDSPPHPTYWTELFRVSENQIVWGG